MINSTVAPSEGPSFFQNFHLSIYFFLRIYELGICKLKTTYLLTPKVVNSVFDRSIYTLDAAA
ncbi:hypothetical protein Anas_13223 [Armadillidium nasatum]|uniref:Uncharacterized protein n=1 Tax=Armadillidium nasatum TaxID=96803 RepID=A0A5N5TFR4_9CRUS|nr:hypothetical protein Anas_13223 [Armadillidium nasatum]